MSLLPADITPNQADSDNFRKIGSSRHLTTNILLLSKKGLDLMPKDEQLLDQYRFVNFRLIYLYQCANNIFILCLG